MGGSSDRCVDCRSSLQSLRVWCCAESAFHSVVFFFVADHVFFVFFVGGSVVMWVGGNADLLVGKEDGVLSGDDIDFSVRVLGRSVSMEWVVAS